MNYRKRTCLLMLIIIFGISISGCSATDERSEKPLGNWSRGLLLGMSNIRHPVALTVDADKQAHVVWQEQIDGDDLLHYTRLNQQGQIVLDKSLSLGQTRPRRPQLLVDEEKNLHLGWLSRAEDTVKLYQAQIKPDGEITEPILISREDEEVESFQMYSSTEGKVTFIWSGHSKDGQSGLFHTVLDDISSPTLLVPDGVDPYVSADKSGTIHLVWLYKSGYSTREIYYATLEGASLSLNGGQKLTSFEFAESATYYGPVIGQDMHNVYVFWSVQNLGGGLTPTGAFAYYVCFEKGNPTRTNPRTVKLPPVSRPDYTEVSGEASQKFGYTELGLLPPDFYGSDFVNAPDTIDAQADELPVMFSLIVQSPSDNLMRLAMAVFSEGELVGYQLASKTANASALPTLIADKDGYLHAAWIDAAGYQKYKVYYASLAPEAKVWLDRTTVEDVTQGAANLLWGVLSAVGLIPFMLMWNVLPLLWVASYLILRGPEYLDQTGAKIGMLVTIIIYTASKLFLLRGLVAGTPFIYRIPKDFLSTWIMIVPFSILLLSIGAIYIYIRRSEEPTLLKAFAVFALTDGLLTIVLYAPRFFDLE
jgi:hypothetical protein